MDVDSRLVVQYAGDRYFRKECDRVRDEMLEEALSGAQSLLGFIGMAWNVVEPATDFVSGEHIRAIVKHLEAVTRGEIRNLLINLPPRHMKSLTVSVFWPVCTVSLFVARTPVIRNGGRLSPQICPQRHVGSSASCTKQSSASAMTSRDAGTSTPASPRSWNW